MRIAVQISGLIHSPHDVYYALNQNLLSRYDCDIYVASSSPAKDMLALNPTCCERVVRDDYKASGTFRIIEKFGNKYYRHKDDMTYHSNAYGIFMGLYQKYHCDQLRWTSTHKYDAVLWMRGDIILAEPFTDQIWENTSGKILTPYGCDYHGGLNDQLCVGDPDVMTTVCSQFMYLDWYLQQTSMHPERLLLHHIQSQQIKLEKFSYTYYLKGRFQCEFH